MVSLKGNEHSHILRLYGTAANAAFVLERFEGFGKSVAFDVEIPFQTPAEGRL
jgi:hypothetical protein